MNLTVVSGHLARPASIREIDPDHRVLSFELSVSGDARSASVPVAWHNPPTAAGTLDEGDEVVVIGRVHRRFFRSGGSTQSRTEVVAEGVIRPRQRSRLRRALTEAAALLDEALEGVGG